MSSSMHAFGTMRAPRAIDRVVPTDPTPARAAVVAASWAAPRASTWVDLPAPSVWAAPDPALLLTITIAPLRFAPVSWAPPTVLVSPWGPPAMTASTALAQQPQVDRRPWYRRRSFAFGMTAVVVATTGAVATLVANL